MVRELVAIDMPACEQFVATIQEIWQKGDAFLPIDQRLPVVAREQLVKDLKVSSVIDEFGEKTKLDGGKPTADGDALVIATSGSTGPPKGVVHTHDSIKSATKMTGSRLECTAEDHWLACISLAHAGGLSVIFRAQHFGSKLTIGQRPDRTTIEDALDKGANLTSLVPSALGAVDISRFKKVLLGGARPPEGLAPNTIVTYGLTETMGGVVYDGSPLDDVEVRLGVDSEIEIRSTSLLRCYRDGTDPKTSDGWLKTGDLGEIINQRLSVSGRKDDLINTGGFKVWPITIENSIKEIEQVADVVVASTPDKKWGSAVTAWVVMHPDQPNLTLKDIRRHVRSTLPDYCAPQILFIVNQIPRSSLGKVQMNYLRNLLPISREMHV